MMFTVIDDEDQVANELEEFEYGHAVLFEGEFYCICPTKEIADKIASVLNESLNPHERD